MKVLPHAFPHGRYFRIRFKPWNYADQEPWHRPHTYQHQARSPHLSAPPYLRRQRSRPGPNSILQAIQIHQALPPARDQVRRCTFFPRVPPSAHSLLISSRAANTANPQPTARSLTASTNASSAPAAPPPVPRTGGTARNTLALPSYYSLTVGSWIAGMSIERRGKRNWIIA